MNSIVAIAVAINMCMSGSITLGVCNDGSLPFMVTLSILKGTIGDDCKDFKWETGKIKECVNSWDSVLELRRGQFYDEGQLLFRLRSDGTVETHSGYKVDDAAMVFYKALVLILDQRNVLNK